MFSIFVKHINYAFSFVFLAENSLIITISQFRQQLSCVMTQSIVFNSVTSSLFNDLLILCVVLCGSHRSGKILRKCQMKSEESTLQAIMNLRSGRQMHDMTYMQKYLYTVIQVDNRFRINVPMTYQDVSVSILQVCKKCNESSRNCIPTKTNKKVR